MILSINVFVILATISLIFLFACWSHRNALNVLIKLWLLCISFYGAYLIFTQNLLGV